MKGMRIPAVGKLITGCWERAEQGLRDNIRTESNDSNEEFITWSFRSKLKVEVESVSATKAVASAFMSDLKQAFPKVADESISGIARGLVATVSFPDHTVEAKTGGDIGIVLVRPDLREARYSLSELTVDHDYERGLLCQAKILRRNSRWGTLTPEQKRILPKKLGYFALLLYRYADHEGDRRELEPFGWQLADGATLEQLSGWLASDAFPNLQDSRQVLGSLLRDEIGTDVKQLIDTDIAPELRRSCVIRIGWRDGDGPGSSVHVRQRANRIQVQQVVQRQ